MAERGWVAVVTGATRGLGKGIALALAEGGSRTGKRPVRRAARAQRARLRLAATHAARAAAGVVDRVYHLCGGASIWDDNPVSRCFRDVHVMTQHVMVGPSTLEPIGRIALGLPTETSMI